MENEDSDITRGNERRGDSDMIGSNDFNDIRWLRL